MKKWILLALLVFGLWAKTIEAEYKVSYGIFGQVAKSKAMLETNESNYTIHILAKATGMAKILSNGRVEEYRSKGRVVQGLLRPSLFEKIRKNVVKVDKKRFLFDYEKKRITIQREIYKQGKLIQKSEELLPYFASEDILTLYFNIKHYLKPDKHRYRFRAVGGERHTGRIEVIVPEKKRLRELKELLGRADRYLVVILHQKIFASRNGELYIALDRDGITKKAMLKDVIMFGDIVGKLIKKRIVE